MKCTGDSKQMCGGSGANSVYSTECFDDAAGDVSQISIFFLKFLVK
jgi:hypothetical protein